MKKVPTLYKKPFVTAAFFAAAAAGLMAYGFNMTTVQKNMDGYGLVVLGGMASLTALVIGIVYAVLNIKFKRLFSNPLLFFEASESQHKASTEERAKAIKHSNKTNLIIMLVFCAIAAILGPIVKDDGIIMSYIALGLGLFLTVFALAATKYRIHKLHTSPHLVILAENGAFIDGELHLWRLPNLFQKAALIRRRKGENGILLKIEYLVITRMGPVEEKCFIPIESDMLEQAEQALQQLQGKADSG